MKKLSSLLLSICLFIGCTKNNGPATPPEENKPPFRIEKRILRHKVGSDLQVDTLAYQYDDSGRVTRKDNFSADFYEEYFYTNGKISSIKATSSGVTNESLNFARYSDNGDTILLDFTMPDVSGQGMDTVQLTYIFKDGYVIDYWTYLHNFTGFIHLQKESFVYNSQGNVQAKYIETLFTPRELQFEVIEWDNKINPRHNQPKLNHMLLDTGLPLQSYSVHNPTKFKDALNNIKEFELTYNTEGYPLTVKDKNENYITTELIYNR